MSDAQIDATLIDLIVHGARRLQAAGVSVGHHQDNPLDEARALVLHALALPEDWPAHLGKARILAEEVAAVDALFDRRINERIPAAYLLGFADFAELRLKTDPRALVPRSPIAELILDSFQSLDRPTRIERALDLCTGGGSIALAMAAHHPDWRVDGADISVDALSLAAENRELLGLDVELIESDLFEQLRDRRYDLIVSNPPYLSTSEFDQLPAEYAHEPALALPSGTDGLDITLRILVEASHHLSADGLLVVEIGEAERALRRLLPELPLHWIEFSVGQMGVFAVRRETLVAHQQRIADLISRRG